jgi:hypothetical protein
MRLKTTNRKRDRKIEWKGGGREGMGRRGHAHQRYSLGAGIRLYML